MPPIKFRDPEVLLLLKYNNIPNIFYNISGITLLEANMLGLFHGYFSKGLTVFLSNRQLKLILNSSASTISDSISRLKRKKFIESTEPDGRRRIISSGVKYEELIKYLPPTKISDSNTGRLHSKSKNTPYRKLEHPLPVSTTQHTNFDKHIIQDNSTKEKLHIINNDSEGINSFEDYCESDISLLVNKQIENAMSSVVNLISNELLLQLKQTYLKYSYVEWDDDDRLFLPPLTYNLLNSFGKGLVDKDNLVTYLNKIFEILIEADTYYVKAIPSFFKMYKRWIIEVMKTHRRKINEVGIRMNNIYDDF